MWSYICQLTHLIHQLLKFNDTFYDLILRKTSSSINFLSHSFTKRYLQKNSNIWDIKFPRPTLSLCTLRQKSARLSALVLTSWGRLCILRPISVLVSKFNTMYHKSRYRSCLWRPKLLSLLKGNLFFSF